MQGQHPAGADVADRLRRLEQRYESLIRNIPDAIWTADANGRAEYISPRIEAIFGFSPDEVYQRGESLWYGRIHPDDVADVRRRYTRLFEAHEPFDVIYQYHHRAGHWIWVHDRSVTTYEVDGRRFADGTLTDITHLRKAEEDRHLLEEQLRHASKLEAVGRLSAGIAHDFNNLLTAILGYAELIVDDANGDQSLVNSAREIQDAGQRGAAMVRQLLAFSRRQDLQLTSLHLPTLVANLAELLRRVVGEDIILTLHDTTARGMVRADAGQLEQIVMNLVVNARDAMPKGGEVVVETSDEDVSDDGLPGAPEVARGSYVVLAVKDSGIGMDAQTARRAIEPFFTTKDVGKGTGLGLSQVYGLTTQLGGALTILSAPGRGTTVRVFLPRSES